MVNKAALISIEIVTVAPIYAARIISQIPGKDLSVPQLCSTSEKLVLKGKSFFQGHWAINQLRLNDNSVLHISIFIKETQ